MSTAPRPGDPAPGDPDAPGGPPDAAASGPLTPGGARLRHPPAPGPDAEPEEVPGLPRIPLKQYYLAVVMMLVGIGVGLYGVVDIYEGRAAADGGFTTVSIAKVLLGVVLTAWGQRILREATHDPRAGDRG